MSEEDQIEEMRKLLEYVDETSNLLEEALENRNRHLDDEYADRIVIEESNMLLEFCKELNERAEEISDLEIE